MTVPWEFVARAMVADSSLSSDGFYMSELRFCIDNTGVRHFFWIVGVVNQDIFDPIKSKVYRHSIENIRGKFWYAKDKLCGSVNNFDEPSGRSRVAGSVLHTLDGRSCLEGWLPKLIDIGLLEIFESFDRYKID